VFCLSGSVTPYVIRRVCFFGAAATAVWLADRWLGWETGLGVAPYEIIGVVLALLLVMRSNSGYDRWYEGRKLWGGIVNQSRNLAMIGLEQGPEDPSWRAEFVRWVAAFSHACRHSLRGERDVSDLDDLLDERQREELSHAQHLPLYVAGRIDALLREAVRSGGMDRFAYLQAQDQRMQLIDHLGACERILKTPLAHAFSVKIRRFLFIYLLALPLAIVDKAGNMTAPLCILVAYPLLSIDQLGIELQNPFSEQRLDHLPLNDICDNIQGNLMALLESTPVLREREASYAA
jgi:putative membrane protein